MEKKANGLSRDLIFHPGETLVEILEDRCMSQRELAKRTGVTEKHVSTIINGTKPISVAYAKKLEYALSVDSSFWINMQANYDREIMEFEEVNSISRVEISILGRLKDIVEYLGELKIITKVEPDAMKVLSMRKFLNISNLADITDMSYQAVYRVQTTAKQDFYVLFAWQRLCEFVTADTTVSNELDIEQLQSRIPEIKQLMFERPSRINSELIKIFGECGIAFAIVRHFVGAPVQGFIKKCDQGKTILCMTIRQSFADRFWFTLFHEIAHLIHGDVKKIFLDFDSSKDAIEEKADEFARNVLIPHNNLKKFIDKSDFTLPSIELFSKEQNVQPYIVIGRLQKENYLAWTEYSSQMTRYKWVEEEHS
jgi:HTH-type transcriptional regulator/antitoxin HigA